MKEQPKLLITTKNKLWRPFSAPFPVSSNLVSDTVSRYIIGLTLQQSQLTVLARACLSFLAQ